MKKLRNLTVLFLFVFAAMGLNPATIQAEEPEAPGPECTWSYGVSYYSGTWTCPWGCFHYQHVQGKWRLTGSGSCDDLPMYD